MLGIVTGTAASYGSWGPTIACKLPKRFTYATRRAASSGQNDSVKISWRVLAPNGAYLGGRTFGAGTEARADESRVRRPPYNYMTFEVGYGQK